MSDDEPNAGADFREAPQRFELSVERDADGVQVRIVGDLDVATVTELDKALEGLEAHAQGGRLLVDLDGVEFMDSTGLAGLLRAQKFADSNGHKLTLRSSGSQVQKLFDLTGLGDRFTFEA